MTPVIITYLLYILVCALLTVVYTLWRRAAMSPSGRQNPRGGEALLETELAKRLTYIPTAEGQEVHQYEQAGYQTWFAGTFIFWFWAAIPLCTQVHLLFHGLGMFVFAPAYFGPRTDEWIFVFCISHGSLLVATAIKTRLDTFFMRECKLIDANYVAISCTDMDPANSVRDPTSFYSRSSSGRTNWMRGDVLIKSSRGYLAKLVAFIFEYLNPPETDTTVVKVMTIDGSTQRYFEYSCIRYLFNERSQRFQPCGKHDVTGTTAHEVLRGGGTPSKAADRLLVSIGRNEMNIEVPSVFMSLWTEFFDYVHIFQMIGVWNYVGYNSPNLSIVWFFIIFGCGAWKSLKIVRKNQLNIRELATAESDQEHQVFRDGTWVVVKGSSLVLGDIVQVREGQVPADIAVIAGTVVVNESMLTGEPMPVYKVSLEPHMTFKFNLQEHGKKHGVCAGTEVMQSQAPGLDSDASSAIPNWISEDWISRGYPTGFPALGMVVSVAGQTTKGQLIRMVLFPSVVKFKYTEDLVIIYTLILLYTIVIALIVGLLRGQGRGFAWWFFSACSILTETLNPMMGVSIDVGQSSSSTRLGSIGITCLSTGRIPIAGKVSVMIFDKTGTITHGGMDLSSVRPIASGRFSDAIQVSTCNALNDELKGSELLTGLASCHNVTVLRSGQLVGNAVEVSQVNAVGWSLPTMEDSIRKIRSMDKQTEVVVTRVLEFDHNRMTSGVVVQVQDTVLLRQVLYLKGAYDKIQEKVLPESIPPKYQDACNEYAGNCCYYVLALAWKEIPVEMSSSDLAAIPRDELESGLQLCGLMLFKNSMKPDSASAIADIQKGNILCVMCTGDNAVTGVSIGRQAGIFSAGVPVLIGDTDGDGKVVWQDVDTSEQIDNASASRGSFSSVRPDAQLALTQKAFHTLLRDGDSALERILPRVRVFGRMKPEDKIKVIQLWQNYREGFVTGMAGDGGNDCGALRVAHIGIALSEAEASMVSPFSTAKGNEEQGYISLTAVHDLLLEGRACISTNLSTYMAFIHYCILMSFPRLIVVAIGEMCWSEWHYICIDIFIGVFAMVWVMTSCRPAQSLAEFRPTGSLLGNRTCWNLVVTLIIFHVWLLLMWRELVYGLGKDIYQPWDSQIAEIPSLFWMKKADNHIMAVLFPYTVLWLASVCFVFSYGHVHRENVFKNVKVVVTYVIFIAFVLFMYWSKPNSLNCLFRTNCDNPASLATGTVWYEKIFVMVSMGDIGGCFAGPQMIFCDPPHPEDPFCWVVPPADTIKQIDYFPGWTSTDVDRIAVQAFVADGRPPFKTYSDKTEYCHGPAPYENAPQDPEHQKYCFYPVAGNNCRPDPSRAFPQDSTGCVQPHNCFNHELTARLTIMMACSVIMLHLVYRWLLTGGFGDRFHRPTIAGSFASGGQDLHEGSGSVHTF